jgi:hypothetical protein
MGDPLTLCYPEVFKTLIGCNRDKCTQCINLGAEVVGGTNVSCLDCPTH